MPESAAAAEVSTSWRAAGPPVSLHSTSPLAAICTICLIGPVSSAVCRMAST